MVTLFFCSRTQRYRFDSPRESSFDSPRESKVPTLHKWEPTEYALMARGLDI